MVCGSLTPISKTSTFKSLCARPSNQLLCVYVKSRSAFLMKKTVLAFRAPLDNFSTSRPLQSYSNGLCKDHFSCKVMVPHEGTFTSSRNEPYVFWRPLISCYHVLQGFEWLERCEKSRRGEGIFPYEVSLYANLASSADSFSSWQLRITRHWF